jgi:hypothetical protein
MAESYSLCTLRASLAESGLGALLDRNEAEQYYKDKRQRHEEHRRLFAHLQENPEKDFSLALRNPDLKNAAFYVELDVNLDPSGKVMTPSDRVEEREAKMTVPGLGWFLDEYAPLSTIVGDDGRWRDFAERVRWRLPDTKER